MGKRATVQAAKPVNKKAKIDPVLESVAEVINEAEHLPEKCRVMLVELLPLSVNIMVEKRHELQTLVVGMVEETLSTKKYEIEAALAAENLKLSALKGSEGELISSVKELEFALNDQQEVVEKANGMLADKTTLANASTAALAGRKDAQTAGDKKMEEAKKQKAALEAAFETHFKAPMAEGLAGPHFNELEPFLNTIEIEASLLTALPSSCAKSKEHRGAFDDVVLQELEKAINCKLESLSGFLVTEVNASLERQAAVQAAETEDETNKIAQCQATADLESAQKEFSEREAKLNNAKLKVEEFQPQLAQLAEAVDKVEKSLAEFEDGPLANFMACKTKTGNSAPVEVAPGGA
jgi:chromosome segregation ATPase